MEMSKVVEEEPSSSYKKQKGPQNDNDSKDRLTDLPDSVLVHILSFLPTKDAVGTVLIRRFGYLWTSIHSLDFDCYKCPRILISNKRMIDLIDRVLILHTRSDLHRFRLRFPINLQHLSIDLDEDDPNVQGLIEEELRISSEIDSWISFAVRKNVKVLDLNLTGSQFEPAVYYKLADAVLSSFALTELKLVCCRVEPNERQVQMGSLKTLTLDCVLLSNDTMADILSGCPLLENLFIVNCKGLLKLNFASVNLKKVTVDLGSNGRIESSKLEISCPYVETLDISGWIELVDLRDASSLLVATLDFSINFKCTRGEYHEVKMLLEKLQHANVFTMKNNCILVLTVWELMNLPCPCLDLKCLFLETMLTKWHLPGIACLLRNSPNLEMLDIHIYNGSCGESSWWMYYELDEEHFWNSQQQCFDCLTSHLRTIRLDGFVIQPRVIQLVQFLLERAVVLEKMVIITKQYLQPNKNNNFVKSGRMHDFSEQLLSFPRASNQVKMMFF